MSSSLPPVGTTLFDGCPTLSDGRTLAAPLSPLLRLSLLFTCCTQMQWSRSTLSACCTPLQRLTYSPRAAQCTPLQRPCSTLHVLHSALHCNGPALLSTCCTPLQRFRCSSATCLPRCLRWSPHSPRAALHCNGSAPWVPFESAVTPKRGSATSPSGCHYSKRSAITASGYHYSKRSTLTTSGCHDSKRSAIPRGRCSPLGYAPAEPGGGWVPSPTRGYVSHLWGPMPGISSMHLSPNPNPQP